MDEIWKAFHSITKRADLLTRVLIDLLVYKKPIETGYKREKALHDILKYVKCYRTLIKDKFIPSWVSIILKAAFQLYPRLKTPPGLPSSSSPPPCPAYSYSSM